MFVRTMKTEAISSEANDMPQSVAKATIRLAIIKAKKSPLVEYLQKNIKTEVGVEEVRSRLSKIRGSIAHEITENRAERL